MKNNKKTLKENTFRSLIRKEIKKILEAEEGEKAPEAAPEPEEEEGMNDALQGAVGGFVRKLKDIGGVESDDIVEIVSNVIEAFADSSEQKLNILRGVKSSIVR